MSLRGTLRCADCNALYSSLAGCDCHGAHPRRREFQAKLRHGICALAAANAIAVASGSRIAACGFALDEAEHTARTWLTYGWLR